MSQLDVLIVNPPSPDGHIYIRDVCRWGRRSRERLIWPQTSLAYLAAMLPDDMSVEIIDAIAEPDNRNVVLFPRKINGAYWRMDRPFSGMQGGVWVSQSPDLIHWGRHRCIMESRRFHWDRGKIGPGNLAHALCNKRRPSIGLVDTPAPLPPGLDFDLWAGPAPAEIPIRKKLHYDWHWDHRTGNGDLGNQNPHELDKARWGLGKQTLPTRVVSLGGRLGYIDNGDMANSQVTI